jgi:hypothetical protein
MRRRSRKKPPVGPSSGSIASRAIPSAHDREPAAQEVSDREADARFAPVAPDPEALADAGKRTGRSVLGALWIYFLAPLLGMLLAAATFRRHGVAGCAKLDHSPMYPASSAARACPR